MRAFLVWIGIAVFCVAMLSGCPKRPEEPAAPAAETSAEPTTPATAPTAPVAVKAPEAVEAPAPIAPSRSVPAETPIVAKTPREDSPREKAPSFDPSAPDRACKTDNDCAVKDVGNCCGYFPMCVNKNANTDPAAVRAQCEASGISSICGFQDVKGCQCVQGRCENVADGAVIM